MAGKTCAVTSCLAAAGGVASCFCSSSDAANDSSDSGKSRNRGERWGEAQFFASGRLAAAFDKIARLEVSLSNALAANREQRALCSCWASAEGEARRRQAVEKPFLVKQIEAQRAGIDVVDAPVAAKLARDAAVHAVDFDPEASLDELRKSRRLDRLPSRLLCQSDQASDDLEPPP